MERMFSTLLSIDPSIRAKGYVYPDLTERLGRFGPHYENLLRARHAEKRADNLEEMHALTDAYAETARELYEMRSSERKSLLHRIRQRVSSTFGLRP